MLATRRRRCCEILFWNFCPATNWKFEVDSMRSDLRTDLVATPAASLGMMLSLADHSLRTSAATQQPRAL